MRGKKIVQTALQHRQPLLYPPLSFSTLLFVLRPFPHALNACNVRASMTRELVIKPSFNLSLVIRNCQRRGQKKRREIIMLIRANTPRRDGDGPNNGDYNKRRIRDGK